MNMNKKQLREGLADMAYRAESDHEVQMARAELYKIAKYSIKLHEMLKNVSEQEGLEGWVQSKITKSADYLGSVYHHMDYQVKFDEVAESKDTHCSDKCCGSDVKREDCKCAPTCKHCNCNAVAEDLAPTKDQLKGKELDALRNKNVAKMDAEDKAARKKQADKFAAMKNESTDYKTSLMNKLSASLGE